MATFGNEAAPTSYQTMTQDQIRGTVFTCPENCEADQLSVCIRMNTTPETINVKCAIYRHSDLELMGSTPQVAIDATLVATWFDFPFVVKPSLVAGTAYVLCVFFDFAVDSIRIGRIIVAEVDSVHYQLIAYNDFPDPLVPTHQSNYYYCIHCDYTPSAPPSSSRKTCSKLVIGF